MGPCLLLKLQYTLKRKAFSQSPLYLPPAVPHDLSIAPPSDFFAASSSSSISLYMSIWRRQPTVCSFQTASAASADGIRFLTLDGKTHHLLHCKHVFAIVDGLVDIVGAVCACEPLHVPHERTVRWGPGALPSATLHVRLPDGKEDAWQVPAVLHCRLECAWVEGGGRVHTIMEVDVAFLEKQWWQCALLVFRRCDCNWRLRRRVIVALQDTPCPLRQAIVSFV